MVYLSRIYTRTGDDGTTGLGDGTRVPKDGARIAAIGDVDELNASLGLLLAHDPRSGEAALIRDIQNDLFDVGADLCVPLADGEPSGAKLRLPAERVRQLEIAIDRVNGTLQPLTSFILPGGTPLAAWCHFARTVCRRAERTVVALSRERTVNPHVLTYLNRLSDLLFVLARSANVGGAADVLWKPGG